jgi:LysM repeat protein/transposase-like protein
MRFVKFLLFLLILGPAALAQSSELKMAYVEQYKAMAIENMHRTGVPASITLAQGILESGVGKSPLAVEANNHFGIKCHKEWTGPTFTMDDDEKDECFRKYASVLDSYLDHAAFLKSRPRYADLFKLDITDYKGWANGLKAAGYATNPNYAPLLIKQIEELGLSQYDKMTPEQLAALRNTAPVSKPAAVESTTVVAAQAAPVPCQPGVFKVNKVKVVCAKTGDSPLSIAEEHGLYAYQVLKYNDLTEEARFTPGELIYLEAKRKRAEIAEHVVSDFESVRDLSQRYGISTSAIRRKNQLKAGEEFAAGETAYLINKRSQKPQTRTLAEIEKLKAERDRREAAQKKPAPPVTVPAKNAPAFAAPVEKTQPKPAAVTESKTTLDIKRPEVAAIRDTLPAKPAPAKVEMKSETKVEPSPVETKPKETPAEKVATDVPAAKDGAAAPAAGGAKKHLVVKGDTLFNISRRYGLTVAELRSLNNLTEADAIKLGMELIVSK